MHLKILTAIMIFTLVMLLLQSNSLASGFFSLDFVGDSVSAWKGAEWKKLLIVTLKDSTNALILMVAMVGGVICAVTIGVLANYYAKIALSILADGHVNRGEGIVVAATTIIMGGALAILAMFALLFYKVASVGLSELIQ